MARTSSKRPTKTVGKGRTSNLPLPSKPDATPTEKSSLGKWLIIAVLLVFAWELGNFFLGSSSGKKNFILQKVSQFSGTDSTGSPMSAFGMIAVGPHELAVADAKGCRVLIFDFNGKLLRSWGKRGDKGPYEFNEPSDVAIDPQGHLYVLDSWNGAIKIFNIQGKYSGTIDLHNTGGFFGPRRMIWTADYFIIPSGSTLVCLSTSNKNVMDILGGKGTGKGEFMEATGVALDKEGNMYVGDRGNNRIQEFDKSGKVIQVFKTRVSPESIALDPQGRLFIGSISGSPVVYDTAGKFLGNLAEQSQPEIPIPTGILYVAPDGTVIIAADDVVTFYRVPEQGKD